MSLSLASATDKGGGGKVSQKVQIQRYMGIITYEALLFIKVREVVGCSK